MTRDHNPAPHIIGEKPARTQRGIRTIETSGALLRIMAASTEPMKLRDLAEAMDIAPAQLHPYLVSLRATGMVEQLTTGLYQLGPFALELGLSRLRAQDTYHETIARIGDLAQQTRLMVAVSVWGLHGVTIVYVKEGAARIHANVRAGGAFALTSTATGRLFAAHLPEETRGPVIARELQERASAEGRFDFDHDGYAQKLRVIRARGYETTLDAPIPGVSAVAVPVFDFTQEMQLAVTVIGPTPLIDLSPGGQSVRDSLSFCRNLSRDLGFRDMGTGEA